MAQGDYRPDRDRAPQDPNTAIILPDESQLSNLLSHLSIERIVGQETQYHDGFSGHKYLPS